MKLKKWTGERLLYTSLFTIYIACYFVSAYHDFKIFDIEYLAMGVMAIFCVFRILLIQNGRISSRLIYYNETFRILKMAMLLLMISFIFQIINSHFAIVATMREVFFLVGPAILVLLLRNSKQQYIDDFFNIVFVIAIIYFYVKFRNELNLESIYALSFRTSYSPFEIGTTSIADIFFYCVLYFAYRKKLVRMFVSAFFGILSFKRFVVIGILLVIVITLVDQMRKGFWGINKYKEVNKVISSCLIFVICMLPLMTSWIMSDKVTAMLESLLGMELNLFMKGRLEMLNYIVDVRPTNYGLGTILSFLSDSRYSRAINLHNDLYRLYYEVTIIGLFSFVYTIVKNTRREIKAFALAAFFLGNLYISNSLTNFLPVLLFHLLCSEFIYNNEGELCKK